MSDVKVLVNKRPEWDEHRRCYVLDFHGRTAVPSVKNVQLVAQRTAPSITRPHPPNSCLDASFLHACFFYYYIFAIPLSGVI